MHWKRMDLQQRLRTGVVLLYDIAAIFAAYWVGLWARFDFVVANIPEDMWRPYGIFTLITLAVSLAVYVLAGLYRSIWRYAGMREAVNSVAAYAVIGVIEVVRLQINAAGISRAAVFVGYVISFVLCVGGRMSYRLLRRVVQHIPLSGGITGPNVMIIGAGAAGNQLIREYKFSDQLSGRVRCIIDDNRNIQGAYLEGVRVVGDRTEIQKYVEKYSIDTICLAMPSASTKDRREILSICNQTGCNVLALPGTYQLIKGEVKIDQLRKVELKDLLGREEIQVNNPQIFDTLHDKRVLVTGGGGSIGSELCRQIAAAQPSLLVIFDIYENNAYEIQQELWRKYPDLDLEVVIGSVRDRERVERVLETYVPEIVFHAAAHKHVPLMEDSPAEAVKNNILGTWNVAELAAEHGVGTFLLISTDKAVNPTNVMGATKRFCELIVQRMGMRYPDTKYVAVRFGNVIGSNGSVIPLFEKQIAEGGPVTVTDPNIIRYFMTIPEAVALVLQAVCYAKGGEVLVLDMGSPVKIDDVARQLIWMTGHTPDGDIKIVYTGLRPGEKLYEELLVDKEHMEKTANDRIFVEHPAPLDCEVLEAQLERLKAAVQADPEHIRKLLQEAVPTYHPAGDAV